MSAAPLRLIRHNVVPPGGFKYLQAETKHWIRAAHLEALERLVIEHRKANQIPVGTDIRGEIEQQICASLGPEWCNNARASGQSGLTFRALVQGTKTLIDWALRGGTQVSSQEADRRAAICSTCTQNEEVEGCKPCNAEALSEVVSRFIIKDPIPHGKYLKNCKICKCRLEIKVRVPLDIIRKHTPEDQMNQLPDKCWVKDQVYAQDLQAQ